MGALFGKTKVSEPAPMPDDNDPAVKAARRRVMETARIRSGRASTMLSDSYDRKNLGGQG